MKYSTLTDAYVCEYVCMVVTEECPVETQLSKHVPFSCLSAPFVEK